LIEQLVGIAIETLAVQALRDILDGYQFDSAMLATLQNDFEQIIADEDFTTSIKTEKLFMYDEIQRCFTEDRLGGGHISLKGIRRVAMFTEGSEGLLKYIVREKAWTLPLHVLFTHPNKQESREMADRLYASWDKMALKSPAQINADGIGIGKQAMEIVKGNVLLEMLTPPLGRIIEISQRSRTEVQATITILGLLRYKKDKGFYPKNLRELITTGYLKELPVDSYSDKPLVYKKIDGDFILYSIGPNFIDDGGESGKDSEGRVKKWRDNGDTVFWPVPKTE